MTTFPFRAAPDLPLPVRVDAIQPAAPDGDAWNVAIETLWRKVADDFGCVVPSTLRARAALLGLDEPPQGSGAWGSLYARKRQEGWRKVLHNVASTVAERNGASDVWAWVPEEVDHA